MSLPPPLGSDAVRPGGRAVWRGVLVSEEAAGVPLDPGPRRLRARSGSLLPRGTVCERVLVCVAGLRVKEV